MKLLNIFSLSYFLTLVVGLGWRFNGVIAGSAIGAISYVCGSGNVPTCAITAAAGLFLTILGSITGGTTSGSDTNPVRRRVPGHNVWHKLDNGTVLPYFDTSMLRLGVKHDLWDNKGNVYTATRHQSGKTQLSVHLPVAGGRFKTRNEDVSSFTGVYAETGSAREGYGQDDANADAQDLLETLSTGQGDHVCSTLTPTDGGDEAVNIAITPTGTGGPGSAYAECGD